MRCVRAWNMAAVAAAAAVLLQCVGFSQGQGCSTEVPIDETDCTAFMDFCLTYDKYPHNRTAVVVLYLRRLVPDLSVVLSSAGCQFNCSDGEAAPCDVSTQAASRPSRVQPGKRLVQQFYAFNTVRKYFCATVSLDRCNQLHNVIHTSTDNFEESVDASALRVWEPRRSVAAVVVSASLAAAAVFAAAAYCIKTRVCNSPLARASLLEESLPDAEAMLPAATKPPSAILLLYCRESDGFARLMAAFRDLLTALTGLEVLDPLDSRRLEEVFPAPASWLSRQLLRRDAAVLVVESAGALAPQRQPQPPHPLHFLFTLALRHMQHDCRIGGDYRRVYKVRFEDITTTTETLFHIVPMRDFRLMRHIGRLVQEIKGETYPPDVDDVNHSKELLRNVPEADRLFMILRELTG